MDKKEQNEIISLIAFVILIILVSGIAKLQYQYIFFIAVVAFLAGLLRITKKT